MATIKDIANELNISCGTVSKGLNGASDVSEELRNKILKTAIKLGYETKKMKKKDCWTVCFFVENVDLDSNQFGYEILLGFKTEATKVGLKVEIVTSSIEIQEKESYDTYMLRNGYKAGFFVGFTLNDPWLKDIGKTSIPTVLLDNIEEKNPHVAYIGTDSNEGIEEALSHLSKLGHKKVAFLNGERDSYISNSRGHSFRKLCKKYEIDYEDLIAYGDYTTECAKLCVKDFISKGATAIMTCSDTMAIGVINECERLGYKVPEDISVIGFDDLPLSAHVTPPLTTIRQERRDLGKQGFYTLWGLINGVRISHTTLRPEFIVRKSTAKAKS